ncbi:hypothetical protein [Halomicrococcus sp. SG-WS-1]|uniref:hypothetical protein n=1 Tax=Halomicrococcus sp. SG-WS-1 TaxID=3439057 RepID=UPI003F7A043B
MVTDDGSTRGVDRRPNDRLDRREEESAEPDGQGALRAGLAGGLFGTVVMTVFRAPIARSLPPTAAFLAKFAGGRPDDHPAGALALHLLYGIAAGGVFGGFVAASDGERVAAELGASEETVGLVAGTAYALALSAFGERMLLGRLLDMDLEDDESMIFHAGHVVYGVALGAWVGSRS